MAADGGAFKPIRMRGSLLRLKPAAASSLRASSPPSPSPRVAFAATSWRAESHVVRAKMMFVGVEAGDLSCHEGDLIIVTEAHGGVDSDTHTWWEGHVQSEPSRIGEFPSGLNYVEAVGQGGDQTQTEQLADDDDDDELEALATKNQAIIRGRRTRKLPALQGLRKDSGTLGLVYRCRRRQTCPTHRSRFGYRQQASARRECRCSGAVCTCMLCGYCSAGRSRARPCSGHPQLLSCEPARRCRT